MSKSDKSSGGSSPNSNEQQQMEGVTTNSNISLDDLNALKNRLENWEQQGGEEFNAAVGKIIAPKSSKSSGSPKPPKPKKSRDQKLKEDIDWLVKNFETIDYAKLEALQADLSAGNNEKFTQGVFALVEKESKGLISPSGKKPEQSPSPERAAAELDLTPSTSFANNPAKDKLQLDVPSMGLNAEVTSTPLGNVAPNLMAETPGPAPKRAVDAAELDLGPSPSQAPARVAQDFFQVSEASPDRDRANSVSNYSDEQAPDVAVSREVDDITRLIREEIIEKQLGAIAAMMDVQEGEKFREKDRNGQLAWLDSRDGKEFLKNPEVQKELSAIEVKGYKKIHQEHAGDFKTVSWSELQNSGQGQIKTTSITRDDGQVIANLTEQTVNTAPKEVTLDDGSTKTVKSYRQITFPTHLEDGAEGPAHFSMALKDENGKNIAEKDALYFTAHYDESGKLMEISSPIPVKFLGKGDDAIGYIERNGKVFTLPVTKGMYTIMEKEVARNKSMDAGIEIEARAADSVVMGSPAKSKKFEVAPSIDAESHVADEVMHAVEHVNEQHVAKLVEVNAHVAEEVEYVRPQPKFATVVESVNDIPQHENSSKIQEKNTIAETPEPQVAIQFGDNAPTQALKKAEKNVPEDIAAKTSKEIITMVPAPEVQVAIQFGTTEPTQKKQEAEFHINPLTGETPSPEARAQATSARRRLTDPGVSPGKGQKAEAARAPSQSAPAAPKPGKEGGVSM